MVIASLPFYYLFFTSNTTIEDYHSAMIAEAETLRNLANTTDELLFECTSFFPFDFFPDQVKVYSNKVDIIESYFFFSKSAITLLIQDIQTVEVDTDLFFGSLKFEMKGYERNPVLLKFILKNKAIHLRQMIMGLVTAKREGIEFDKIDTTIIRKEAKKIGDVREDLMSI